jgi:hypothetical protein
LRPEMAWDGRGNPVISRVVMCGDVWFVLICFFCFAVNLVPCRCLGIRILPKLCISFIYQRQSIHIVHVKCPLWRSTGR